MNHFIPSTYSDEPRGIIGFIMSKLKSEPNIFDTAEMTESWVSPLAPRIDEYVDWYAENGLYLPKEYAQRPSDWTEVLRKIQRAFNLMAQTKRTARQELDNAITKKKAGDESEFNTLVRDVDEGLALFGKHTLDLWRK